MSKAYLVISYGGWYPEDYHEIIEKGFKDIKKAEAYKAELEDQEECLRAQAERCRECNGEDKKCPFYVTPFDEDDYCESYTGYRDNIDYRIDEIDFEE